MKESRTPLERTADLTKRILAVPKAEVDEKAKEYTRRPRKRRRR
jgi:hypothetical protein